MRRVIAAAVYSLIISTSVASAQVGGGGSSSSGGAGATAGRGGGGGALSPGATAPAVPSVGTPGPINPDPQRNNVDVNPPGQRLPGPAPSMSPPAPNIGTSDNPGPSFTPPPGRAQPGAAASTRPGAAQSANSDGYAECNGVVEPTERRHVPPGMVEDLRSDPIATQAVNSRSHRPPEGPKEKVAATPDRLRGRTFARP